MLGEMFPDRKLRSDAGEAGSGQGFRLGPIDLDGGVVEVHRAEPAPEPTLEPALESAAADPDEPANGPVVG